MNDYLLEIMSEIVENYDNVDQIENKLLSDMLEELQNVLSERAVLTDIWNEEDLDGDYYE